MGNDEQFDLPVSPEFYDGISPIHDGVRTWESALNTHIIRMAEQWFGPPTVSTADIFAQEDPELGAVLSEQGAWEGSASLSTSFVLLPHGFETGQPANPRIDETIPWGQSRHAQRIENVIASRGYSMFEFDGRLVAWWSTPSGGACVQYAAIQVAADGSEYLHWYSVPLASLGTMIDNDVARVALTSSIPSLLQAITYLAECPTPVEPDALFSLGGRRRILYGVEDPQGIAPVPVTTLVMTSDSESAGYAALDKSTGQLQRHPSGGLVVVGYAIGLDNGDDYYLSRGIQVAITSAVRTATILEDGFVNHIRGDTSFAATVHSQAPVVTGSDQIWTPTSLT